ncbi:hypothetical protein AB834_05370 [PVC group bacterium (ex Bugula neritina AB1)]|nr:hypothetical protein AB834_05370 [PVC group bacterium (ex Bugula neritina AB1)]
MHSEGSSLRSSSPLITLWVQRGYPLREENLLSDFVAKKRAYKEKKQFKIQHSKFDILTYLKEEGFVKFSQI